MATNTILAIETSCDETAVAILRGNELLASEVASQTEHEAYGGVVPEVASRNHLLHAPRLLESAVKKAGIDLGEVDAFAATAGPGLASSLMIGASIAKGLALGFAKPYLAINHLEGHLLSPFFTGDFEIEPNVSLIVSGGHTLLVEVRGAGRITASSAGRWMTRREKRSTKSQRCLASVIPADRRSSGAPYQAMPRALIFRGACWIRATTTSVSAD